MPQGRQILCIIFLGHLVTLPKDVRLGSLHTWSGSDRLPQQEEKIRRRPGSADTSLLPRPGPRQQVAVMERQEQPQSWVLPEAILSPAVWHLSPMKGQATLITSPLCINRTKTTRRI